MIIVIQGYMCIFIIALSLTSTLTLRITTINSNRSKAGKSLKIEVYKLLIVFGEAL